MNIHVHTAEGIATICGDVLYDINDQLVEPFREIHDAEPQHHRQPRPVEARRKGARSRSCVNSSRFLLPVHDRPCQIEGGKVVGRPAGLVPGPIVQSLSEAPLVPGLSTAKGPR